MIKAGRRFLCIDDQMDWIAAIKNRLMIEL